MDTVADAKWTAAKIKTLRLRLGWSAADFSRGFGCTGELVLNWERGVHAPSSEDVMQLNRLEFYLESYSEQVARGPVADFAMSSMHLQQIYQRDVSIFSSEKNPVNS